MQTGQEHEGRPARPPASPSPRRAGALDVSSCPQSRKDALYTKAREAFGGTRNTASYYRFMRPYLGETLPCVQSPLSQRPPARPLTATCPQEGPPWRSCGTWPRPTSPWISTPSPT